VDKTDFTTVEKIKALTEESLGIVKKCKFTSIASELTQMILINNVRNTYFI